MNGRRGIAVALVAFGALAGATGFTPAFDRRLPRIVFVARFPLADGRIAGIGPAARVAAPGGELRVREHSGRVHALLPEGVLYDVADPSVSWDGTRIAFAATVHPDSAWRIWTVGADGQGLRRVTADPAPEERAGAEPHGAAKDGAAAPRADDFDPCWLPDGRICFASTRLMMTSQQAGYPVSNLFVIGADGEGLFRLTSERNGAEAPSVDPRDGRIVYARWWFNRYLPMNGAGADDLPPGITLDRAQAVRADTVDLWHAVSIRTDGDGIRLAGGDPRERSGQMAYAPLVRKDGTLIGVQADDRSLTGSPGALRIVEFRGGFAERRVLGNVSAFAPALLPDGRLLCALESGGAGHFALGVMDPAHPAHAHVIADVAGRVVSGCAPLAPRPRPPAMRPGMVDPPGPRPLTRVDQLFDHVHTFRFDCLNVFATGPVDSRFPDAPPLTKDVRIRFFATLSRPAAAGGDTLVLVREAPVSPTGGVHQDDMPADVPMFEQLVDRDGNVLRSAMGPAHVPGLNFARLGSGTRCIGCHAGHSALEVPLNYSSATWVNASPSARVTASSRAAGTAGPRAAVDRLTRGVAGRTAWIAASNRDEWLRLEWETPIEVRSVVLYALRLNRAQGTDVRIDRTEIRLLRDGRPVASVVHDGRLAASGTRVEFEPRVIDALEVRPLRVSGEVLGHRAAALAEIETDARLAYDTTP